MIQRSEMHVPARAEVWRGAGLESVHRVHLVVVDAEGRRVLEAGHPDCVTYWRSSAKPIQALPTIAAGAVRLHGLEPPEIAVLCASHSGQPAHLEAVQSVLRKAGCSESDLQCGVHAPAHEPSALELVRAGKLATPVHNNCSGKHAGMLLLSRMLGADPASYREPGGEVQQAILATVSHLTGIGVTEIRLAVDGCGVPVFGLPLSAMALAFARLARPDVLEAGLSEAASVVGRAMQKNAFYVAGSDRLDTVMMETLGDAVICKGGAEGVWCAGLTDRGWGLALKVEDGHRRGASPVGLEVLRTLDVWSPEGHPGLSAYHRPVLENHAGTEVGRVVPVLPGG